MSQNRFDIAAAPEAAASIERARYWFEQYRSASTWEARLIRAIRELSAERTSEQRELR